MQVDVHFYGAGGRAAPGPRASGDDGVAAGYEALAHGARTAERLGYDTCWLTERHFEHDGDAVVPNLVLMGAVLAQRTERIRFGQMFNAVPQWHPLRLAEDFALADIMSGGRMVFGVDGGGPPREAVTLGTVRDDPRASDPGHAVFEESIEVIRAAWSAGRFSYSGRVFTFPPPGIPDLGRSLTHLALVPRPTRHVPVYQPVSSPEALEYCARRGHRGVFALLAPAVAAAAWERYAEIAARGGVDLRPGEDRCLHLVVHVGRTRDAALAVARGPHDRLVDLLGRRAPFRGYAGPERGGPAPDRFVPSLADSVDQRVMAIGSLDDVVDIIGRWRDLLGLEHLVVMPDLPGLRRAQLDEQLHLVAEEVLPRLGVRLNAAARSA